jgi:hypothetical protein
MKKLLFSVLLLAILAAGCAVTDYPVITDSRGSYTGIIRTGHKAYVKESGQVATTWPDGSDDLFTLVYQNQYGDQKLYTFNNYDPSGSVMFLDKTYCDWRYSQDEIVRAWNPANSYIDNPFDYEFFPDASGARSLSLLVGMSSRLGECGDAIFQHSKQDLMGEFANLATTSYRGGTAYVLPINANNSTFTLTTAAAGTQTIPVMGNMTGFITNDLNLILPMTPNMRHELSWVSNWVSQHGVQATVGITYGSLNTNVGVRFAPNGINYNLTRF